MRFLNKHPLLLLTIGVCAALLVPALFMDGMFMDGVLYASVSRNYAEGYGTFWFHTFSETFYKEFHEQPPLMFFLQGTCYRIFGVSLYVERWYCLITAMLTAWIITRIWNLLVKEKDTAWFALLLWFTSPVIFYAYTNNIEECTMTLFVLLALHSILKALNAPAERYVLWVMAGGWLLLAGLTKGVQGMFLLSAPFWAWLILRNGTLKTFLLRTMAIGALPAAFVALALSIPAIRNSLTAYFASRFGKTFAGVTAHATHHFHILFEALLDTLPVIGVTIFLLIAGRKTAMLSLNWLGKRRMIFFLLACGISGILPLMITLEQRGFYLATPLPIVLIALALITQPVALRITVWVRSRTTLSRTLTITGAVVIAVTLGITLRLAGTPKRDGDKIAALHEVAAITGENLIIRSTDALNGDWGFLTYGQRYHHLSFTEQNRPELQWLLTEKGFVPGDGYMEVPLKTQVYSLYRRQYQEPVASSQSQ